MKYLLAASMTSIAFAGCAAPPGPVDANPDSAPSDSAVTDSATAPDAEPTTDAAVELDASAPIDATAAPDAATDGAAPADVAVVCAVGETRCLSGCVNTQSDRLNCGACNNACPMGQSCVRGACELPCPIHLARCGAGAAQLCADLQSDRLNCGACDRACPAGQLCVLGVCGADCPAPRTRCGSGMTATCSDTRTDVNHCGACGNACPTVPNSVASCTAGACGLSCAVGFGNCDAVSANGCEVNTATDVNHCGSCGMRCTAGPGQLASCAAGVCARTCAPGQADCDGNPANGCETTTASDPRHCGGCGRVCAPPAGGTATCMAGVCGGVCPPGRSLCGPVCVDFLTDSNNCGRCSLVCPGGSTCTAGVCTAAAAFVTSPTPVTIPGSAGCSLLLDTNADQIDVSTGGTVYVLLRCGTTLAMSVSTNGARSFSAPRPVPFATLPEGAAVLARTDNEVLVLGGVMGTAQFVRSINQGASWSVPVTVGAPFMSSGPGPALTLAAVGSQISASWSVAGTNTPVFRSTNDGVSWSALPSATAMGTNYCPDLIALPTGELYLGNEGGRAVQRLPNGAPSWLTVGMVGAPTAFTDFAGGGPWLYATGSGNAVDRGPLAPMTATSATSMVPSSDNLRSMDVDPAGNLAFVLRETPSQLRIYSWVSGAPAMDPGVVVSGTGALTPAIAAIPTRRGSVTAFSSTAGVQVHVQVY